MSNTYNYHHPSPISQTHHTSKRGFTIVELLIVIVVVAIFAAISIVSYNGIQQRTNNTAIINAASQSLKVIEAYIATYGSYPSTASGYRCITTQSGCATNVQPPDSVFTANMAMIGTLPASIPKSSDNRYGLAYEYNATTVINGVSQPARLRYWLFGIDQQCGLSGVQGYNGNDMSTSKTLCIVTIPGPADGGV